MKKIILSIFLCVGLFLTIFAQNTVADLQNEGRDFLYINTFVDSKDDVNQLSRHFSVDACPFDAARGQYKVRVALARHEYEAFLALNLPFEIIPEERPSSMVTTSLSDFTTNWNKYPSYQVYAQLMRQFEANHPDICKLDTILLSTPCTSRTHSIFALHISNTLGQNADKPAFLYSSTMHGDEVVGYYMMLRLIDYILNNATTDAEVMNILQNVDLWICPLENPDGTYYSADDRISSSYSRRYNWNNVDLNRNYPFVPGIGGSANVQPESQAIINWVADKHFVMSVNFHGGAELTNYPWDTWSTNSRRHPDDDWFRMICTNYVNDCQAIDPNYMVGETAYQPGCGSVTEGGDWYEIDGSRQDYMNYYQHCREVTIEAHFDKVCTSSAELPTYWTNSKNALLGYIQECLNGFRGIVTDAQTGEPIEAKIWVENHDDFNSEVYSHLPVGDYHRPIKAGNYTVTVSADCYQSQSFNITVSDGACVRLDVQLEPLVSAPQVADAHINMGQTATLTANSNNTISWYATPTATTPLATGLSFTTPQLFDYAVYYVEESATVNGTTCVSERVPVHVFVVEGVHDTVYGNLSVAACDSYTINGQTFSFTGCYSVFFPYAGQHGADSILYINLTIHPSYNINISQTYMVGDVYYIGNEAYTADMAGTFHYSQALETIYGCDSIVNYTITVDTMPIAYSTLYVTECGSYTYEGQTFTASGEYHLRYPGAAYNGYDSVLVLHLTIYPTYDLNLSSTVHVGDTYVIEGTTHYAVAEGTFTYDFHKVTVNGCDSIIHYIVNVISSNYTFGELTLDGCIPFVYEGEVLTTDGDYTFYYPGAGVGGADSTLLIHLTLHPSYEETVNVSLAVDEHYMIGDYDFYSMSEGIFNFDKEYQTVYGCDSTVHYVITVGATGILNNGISDFVVSPNPTSDVCCITFAEGQNFREVRLYDAYGKWVETFSVEGRTKQIDLGGLDAGIYFIQVIDNEQILIKKVIKL